MTEGNDLHNAEQKKDPGEHPPWWKRLWGWTGVGEKKLWDWLQLLGTLAIPVVVAVATGWFSSQQSATQIEVEEQRAQDEALQAYLDQMTQLILEKDLRSSDESATEARTLARARSLTVLRRLDPERKAQVINFLAEASLIQGEKGKDPIVGLSGASLAYTDLSFTDLDGAELTGAELTGANLNFATLANADLGNATLVDASLISADLSNADLSVADLREATLGACKGNTCLSADLAGADLFGTNLRGAKGVTEAQLAEQPEIILGATLPNGQKVEATVSNGQE
jgi:uncharacterized protein YjbI with pentapeptide repeats